MPRKKSLLSHAGRDGECLDSNPISYTKSNYTAMTHYYRKPERENGLDSMLIQYEGRKFKD